jgi:Caspase domain/TIR domain
MLFEDAHALVIGISAYQHLPRLPATDDAKDVADALRDPQICGYPPDNVRLLLDGDATRQAILDELDALARRAGPTATALIYFSGHGSRAGNGDTVAYSYYLMPVDAQSRTIALLESTGISSAELTARLAGIPAGKLTVLLDCCRAAPLAELPATKPATPATPVKPAPPEEPPAAPAVAELGELPATAISPLARGRGRVVLAASRGDGVAYLPDPGAPHSVFTGALLRGLRGAAEGVGGVLRICDLYDYVQRHVVAHSPQQRPVFRAELEENYPIALLLGGATKLIELPAAPDTKPFDVFVTYCDGDDADRVWARRVMIPYLERRGLRVCYERRDFRLGFSRLKETERAVCESRYTVAVFSPAYLASDFDDYQALLAAHASIESGAPRFIPLLRRECQLALHVRMTALLDASRDPQVPAALERLTVSLRRRPVPRHT